MKSQDKRLGMDRGITRRDLLHGVGALAGASLLPGKALADRMLALEQGAPYPPALTGLRGSHPGSFEVAHELARDGRRDWGPVVDKDDGVYDLAVVGAGLSGLAAAHFYRKAHPNARILLLDNHEDFGGHAIRNELGAGGRTTIGYGGSQTLEEPSSYPASAKSLLDDLGIDLDRFYEAYDRRFYKRHKLGGATFFDRKNWGVDKLVPYDLGGLRYTLPLAGRRGSVKAAVKAMPMSEAARAEMLSLLTADYDAFPGKTVGERLEILGGISYRTYISDYLGVTEPAVFAALRPLTTDLGGGIEAVPAIDATYYIGLPGYEATRLPDLEDVEPYIHHFPDGNASVARMLVRNMIPEVAPGSTMEDIVLAPFDYGKLDVEGSPVRLRLSSTVVNARHDGKPGSAKSVLLSYVRDGRHGQIRAKHCVMACYNAIIPSICTEMPEEQRAALKGGVKVSVMYTNVLVNNWRAWKKLGIGAVSAPSSYHVNAMLDFPVDMGGYEFSDGPEEPIVIHMERFPHRPNAGLSKREQAPLGRYELLSTSFETIERNTREQLAAMLADGDFDPARDIEAITVNRWPHGYATRDWLEDDYYGEGDDKRYWFVRGRQRFGRIVIANSDAGATANVESAIEQAYRAIGEIG
ncbi:MAG: FAD/NAD(P)-binding protein [Pseudomonadota bacterium]